MPSKERSEGEELRARLEAMRGPVRQAPDLSVITPVNAQGDLQNVQYLLGDLARYEGSLAVEVVLVVNNFDAGSPPPEVEDFRRLGLVVLAIPNVRRPGEAVGFSARIPGIRAASAEYTVLFDADCRVPRIMVLLDWYAEQFRRGAHAAYTPVAYYDFERALSIRASLALHHTARWVKRNLFRIPTTRGSNYGVRKDSLLDLYDRGFLADEMNVGPAMRRLKGPVAYQSGKKLTVYTSGRMFRPGWRKKIRYFRYRLKYNLRVLPVRAGVAGSTGRENDPLRRYRGNRPVAEDD